MAFGYISNDTILNQLEIDTVWETISKLATNYALLHYLPAGRENELISEF